MSYGALKIPYTGKHKQQKFIFPVLEAGSPRPGYKQVWFWGCLSSWPADGCLLTMLYGAGDRQPEYSLASLLRFCDTGDWTQGLCTEWHPHFHHLFKIFILRLVSLNFSRWTLSFISPASTFRVLGLKICTSMSAQCLSLEVYKSHNKAPPSWPHLSIRTFPRPHIQRPHWGSGFQHTNFVWGWWEEDTIQSKVEKSTVHYYKPKDGRGSILDLESWTHFPA